jgi:predicted RNase H-like nuclease (RuvC/YqgF family)
VLAAAILAVTTGSAAAQGPAVILPEESAVRAAADLASARKADAIIESLKAEIEAQRRQMTELQAQVDELRAEAHAREIAMAIAEDREKRRQEDDGRVATAFARAEATIERSEKALEKAQARIESLERRQFWSAILGPLGLVIGFLARGF